uniref:Endoribonuclease n=1 Tax=Strongyloides venezuelensis TaxID=75913 RepID=A0A0K0F3R6_STRVS
MKNYIILSLFSSLGLLSALPFIYDSSSADVTTILNVMAKSDSNKASSSDIKLDYQNMASHKSDSHDNAPKPLFESVSSTLLAKPSYASFLTLLSTYTQSSIDEPDQVTSARSTAFTNFVESIKSTLPVQTAFNYLKSNSYITGDWTAFEKTLSDLWLNSYNVGYSGFKMVFSGATDKGEVIGFSNWVQFYTLEKSSAINYHGWFSKDKVDFIKQTL